MCRDGSGPLRKTLICVSLRDHRLQSSGSASIPGIYVLSLFSAILGLRDLDLIIEIILFTLLLGIALPFELKCLCFKRVLNCAPFADTRQFGGGHNHPAIHSSKANDTRGSIAVCGLPRRSCPCCTRYPTVHLHRYEHDNCGCIFLCFAIFSIPPSFPRIFPVSVAGWAVRDNSFYLFCCAGGNDALLQKLKRIV